MMDTDMLFEFTMRLYFGDKAYQTRGQFNNPKYRRECLRKVIRLLMNQINTLDTTPRHKQVLMENAEAIRHAIGRNDAPSWDLTLHFVAFIARLLGFDFHRGSRCHSIAYFQEPAQYYTADLLSHGDALQNYYDKKDALSTRKDVVASLKGKGLSDFKVALVLNTTEYEIKKLLKEL
jgi:hypothetical protein